MPSVHKTWATGEIFTSSDVNGALNPSVADHLAFAQEAGTANISIAGNAVLVTVNFPGGRFTSVPIVTATVASNLYYNLKVNVVNSSSTSVGLRLQVDGAATLTATVPVNWFAVQMTK